MTTHGTIDPETSVPRARKSSTDGHSTGDAIEAGISESKAALKQVVETGKTLVTECTGGVRDGIRDKPMQAVLIAAGVGAVIGLIIARRR
jgi:ElaB/YqjD/DUF883 family membrane-anchored ribosome-binding protein